MNAQLQSKLDKLRDDYTQVTGQPFNHFFCPILFQDEDTELAKGHIINKAFPGSSRKWTVQRADVDNFYGSNFEADFVDIQYAEMSAMDILVDGKLRKKFNPKILLNDNEIKYFPVQGNTIPQNFTPIDINSETDTSSFGLKIPPSDVAAAQNQKWEVDPRKDVRLPALVSLIKAAHLTLFYVLGYHYALSKGGYFVGRQILGEFFLKNYDKPKSEVLEKADIYFRDYTHMIRPVREPDSSLKDTPDGKFVFLCRQETGEFWGMIVFIRTSNMLHSVLLPIFEQDGTARPFREFLDNKNELINVSACRLEPRGWEIDPRFTSLRWPKTDTYYS